MLPQISQPGVLRSEGLKDHSDHSVESGLGMGKTMHEELVSKAFPGDLGREAGGLNQEKVVDMKRSRLPRGTQRA